MAIGLSSWRSIAVLAGFGLLLGGGLTLVSRWRIPDQTVATGAILYAANCASCHGAKLQGQPAWQSPKTDGTYPAPPHDENGHTWHHGDAMLTEYVTIGGQAALAKMGVEFNSGMPAFGDTIDQSQIEAILAYIKSTWSKQAEEFQVTVTKNERLDQP